MVFTGLRKTLVLFKIGCPQLFTMSPFRNLVTFIVPYNITVCFFLTCMGKLSIKEIIPNVTSSRLVKMNALRALVNFWIFLSLFGETDWLEERRSRREWIPPRWDVWDETVLHSDTNLNQLWLFPASPISKMWIQVSAKWLDVNVICTEVTLPCTST